MAMPVNSSDEERCVRNAGVPEEGVLIRRPARAVIDVHRTGEALVGPGREGSDAVAEDQIVAGPAIDVARAGAADDEIVVDGRGRGPELNGHDLSS